MSGKFITTQIWITCLSSQRSKEAAVNGNAVQAAGENKTIGSADQLGLVA